MFLQLIKAIRPINLLVIVLTFYVLYELDINSREHIRKAFYFKIILLKGVTIATVLIAAAGYLINDYYDKKIDAINKPTKNQIPKETLLGFYLALNLIALIISYISTSSTLLFSVFPISIFILWLYSFKLKQLPLIGNFSIALLSGLIPFIYLVAMQGVYTDCQTPFSEIYAIQLSIILAFLAFLSTFAREIIKDIEDIKGDKNEGLKTIPILIGIKTAKILAVLFLLLSLLLLTLLVRDFKDFNFQTVPLIALFLFGFTPLLLAIVKTLTGKQKKHFKQTRNLIKIGMFGFLLFLFFHAITL